jgi:TRAP transporter 4TM/12TM fusion protein
MSRRVVFLLFGGITFALSLYLVSRWKIITMNAGVTNQFDSIVGVILVALIIFITYIDISPSLAIVVVVFLVYPFVGKYLPGMLHSRAYTFKNVSSFLFASGQGIYGIPIGVSATYIVTFSIFGAFLSEFGTGDFFFNISRALTKGFVAAAAKTAVIFSALVGMISGSAAGNVAVSGTFTIPMMKKEGYKDYEAGAIEAVVSTGGQIMPPIMGAAAFLMAEIIGIEYRMVMKAAVVPALVYFISIFAVVHFQAKRDGRTAVSQGDHINTSVWSVLKSSWYHIFPLAGLIFLLVSGTSPFRAAFVAIILSLSLTLIMDILKKKLSIDFIKRIGKAVSAGIMSVIPIAVACAAAGIVSGILSYTGLGSKISSLIVHLSGGIPFIALFFTMIFSIIIGMGLPTTAAYLILASVIAPALSKLGIPILSAHLFVFYFGCMSTITPPVALASFVAAGISGASVEKVSWTAFRYGLTSYILPYMFVYSSALLLNPVGSGTLVLALVTAFAGSVVLAMGIVGYFKVRIGVLFRLLLIISGALMLHQGVLTDLIGVLTTAIVFVIVLKKESNIKMIED